MTAHVWKEEPAAGGGTDYTCSTCYMSLHRPPGLSDFAWEIKRVCKAAEYVSEKGMEQNRKRIRFGDPRGVHADVLDNCEDFVQNFDEKTWEKVQDVLQE